MSDGFKPPKVDLTGVTFKHGPIISVGTNAAIREVQRAHENAEKRADETLLVGKRNNMLLEDINNKLEGLDEIIRLLIQSTSHQKEILELLNETFSIGTAPDEETALSRYEKVEGKINRLAEVYESAKSLIGLAKYVYAITVG